MRMPSLISSANLCCLARKLLDTDIGKIASGCLYTGGKLQLKHKLLQYLTVVTALNAGT